MAGLENQADVVLDKCKIEVSPQGVVYFRQLSKHVATTPSKFANIEQHYLDGHAVAAVTIT